MRRPAARHSRIVRYEGVHNLSLYMPLIRILLKCLREVHKYRKIGVNYKKKLYSENESDLW